VVLMGLWVRSERWCDELRGRVVGKQAFVIDFLPGRLVTIVFRLEKLIYDWPPWRFNLRSLFIATTFLAVVLGISA
jgi:hypothetical protein